MGMREKKGGKGMDDFKGIDYRLEPYTPDYRVCIYPERQ